MWKSAREVWNDSSLSELKKHRLIWDLFLSKDEQARICRECLKHSDSCLCGYPWPSRVAAYSRAHFDHDMRMIDWFSSTVSEARRRNKIDGFQVVKLEEHISQLRRKCSDRLFISRLMASDRRAPTYKEAMDTQMARESSQEGVELTNENRPPKR